MKKLSCKSLKKYLNKYVEVEWLDPTTHLSEYIEKVLEKPFSVHRNNGKLVHVGRDVLILEHDKCELEGDYTTVFIGLVAGIKKL